MFWQCVGCCGVSCVCLCMIHVVFRIVSVGGIRPFLNFEIQIWLSNGSFLPVGNAVLDVLVIYKGDSRVLCYVWGVVMFPMFACA